MLKSKERNFLKGNRTIFYVMLPVLFFTRELFSHGLIEIDFIGFIVFTSVALLVLEGLNWISMWFNNWMNNKREFKKTNNRKSYS